MAVSMTGFGTSAVPIGQATIHIEMKTVNHRYSDIMLRMPGAFHSAEHAVRKHIAAGISRGKIDVFMSIEGILPSSKKVYVDWELLADYLNVAEKMDRMEMFTPALSAESFILHSDVVHVTENPQLGEEWQDALLSGIQQALDAVVVMRAHEGLALTQDLQDRLFLLEDFTKQLEARVPSIVEGYRSRLEQRLKEVDTANLPNEDQLYREVILFAEKISIAEEITRLYAHIKQFSYILNEQTAVGRKLDFLLQEMNREMNTIGSKASDAASSHIVVDMKSELEKMREQVQNIE
ncbi:uncharacterized protein (TIGR00255 family) [Sinobaca qinghaiensis]|uniref:Uncharacterized protein (TIGR00255 family) n=1 Tax=Sinobaca qinghaiensis TaxID=342944 RepID=A0A419V616_9BACL|nr:YicC/YloC family endoribonuclease [Sinobaca qinghaiensis]RKD75424.1 uncharacterized protein (TIGR00255 family) [Sinobaca qinghaiensis]